MCTGAHAYIPAANTAEARLIFSTPGGIAENVLNFHKDSGWATEDLSSLGGGLADWWDALMQGGCSDTIALEQIIVTDISSETGGQITYTASLPIQGSNTALPLPMNATAVISWRTPLRGRSYRGRTYHVGLCINATDGSELTTTARDELASNYNELLGNTYFSSEFKLAIVSRCQDGQWLTNAVVTEVQGLVVDLVLDSQRRRLPGRGQ